MNFIPEYDIEHSIPNILKFVGKGIFDFILICTLAKYNQVFLTGSFLVFLIICKNKYGYFNSLHKQVVNKYKNEIIELKAVKKAKETEVHKSEKK